MRIAMIGTGYVGLVTGTCFAAMFNHVTCVDIDEAKIQMLKEGDCPIFEPGLPELMDKGVKAGYLSFTTDLAEAVQDADIVFLAVCTPQDKDGSADISQLVTAAEQIAPYLGPDTVVVIKSTAPPNTTSIITEVIRDKARKAGAERWTFGGVVYNPEFLREGSAVNDFMHPDRVVIGAYDHVVKDVLFKLYKPFLWHPRDFMMMSPQSASMVKYAANAMLATKISFINEVANICDRVGGDIDDVRAGMCKDPRIGNKFLAPGVGYGGSCFPKDVTALAHIGTNNGITPFMMEAVDKTNYIQKEALADKICEHFPDALTDKVITLWGLAFKPNTDDIREAPACVLIDFLLAAGAKLRVHDPEALDNIRKVYGNHLEYFTDKMEALKGADALAISTEWRDYCLGNDFERMKELMNYPAIFDGRNIFDPTKMGDFDYYSIGRQTVYKDGRG